MHLFGWFFIGLFFGMIANLLVRHREPGGYFVTSVLGLSGSMAGGFIGALFPGPWDAGAWIGSVVGTVVILALYAVFTARQPQHA